MKSVFLILAATISQMSWAADSFTCQTYSRGRPYSYSSYDENYARQTTYSMCRNDFGSDAWECERNLTCNYYSGYPSQPPASMVCSTFSNGYSFNRTVAPQDANWGIQTVINECTSSRWTDNWECRNNASCSGNGGGYNPPPYNPPPYNPPPGEYCPTPGRGVNQCTTRTSGGMAYVGRVPMDAIRQCQSGESVRPQGRPYDCTCSNTTCN
jgi:hypothetical protein